MKTNRLFLIMVLFTGLILFVGMAGASNLTLTKAVDGGTTYSSGENITWTLTVVNHNQTTSADVNVTEKVPPGCVIEAYLPHNGTVTDNVWSIHLDPDASEELPFNMSCNLACGSRLVENIANITSPEPGLDDNPVDNNARATVTLTAPACTSSNLSLKKTVVGKSTYNLSEKITWLIEVINQNTTESIPIEVTDQINAGCTILDGEASAGEFSDGVWSLDLAANTTETLRINTSCTKICGSQTVTNIARITSPSPDVDDNPADNNSSSSVTIQAPSCVNTTVRPVTLNLKSKGILTVFFTIGGQLTAVEENGDEEDESESGVQVNRESSSLSCNGVEASKMGKFQRQTLSLEATNGTAQLDCGGTIVLSDGGTISVQGNNTIKVIHAEAKQKQSLFQRILAFLGLASGDDNQSEDSETEITTPVNTDQGNHLGQIKKILKTNIDDESEESEGTTVPATSSEKGQPENAGTGNGKKDNPPGQDKGKNKGNS
jgi:hypothetical protein